ncbi:hypothetical protein C1H46_005791 [Malus baccata]|uniref:Uncharacterized protein n=1 Tax=Malus baccata TaxID=106549 RepID=A0A540NC41_MALBA|nr:hypothetical protein C1H46_005791 [Malus baccata]
MVQKKDDYLANFSYQHPNVPVEELTPDPEVPLQVQMDGVGRRKGKEVYGLGPSRVQEIKSCSSSSSTAATEIDSRLGR